MEMKQAQEWKIAQNVNVSVDLISAAKLQLKFLAAVDQNSWLYEDASALQRAIYRYNACWLPMLAKHTKSPFFEGPLVVPLDCEWVWHCHRLNPITYKSDCQKLFGMILDNENVVSSVQEIPEKETEEAWKNLYPNVPYVLDPNVAESDNNVEKVTKEGKFTEYDLVSAVQRQTSFFYQVSRPHMSDERYLEGAVARYKGFLHLTKRNMERRIRIPLVPTYDIDLIWHTHQLHPVSYCKDLVNLIGKILGHDDTDSDRTKGQKLDVGLSGTINCWARMYGSRYCRAGAMYRGAAPASSSEKKLIVSNAEKEVMPSQELKIMEIMIEAVKVKEVPEEHKGKKLFISISKTKPDVFCHANRKLPILSESEEKQLAIFQCQPTGQLLLELMVESLPSKESSQPSSQTLGSCSISIEELLIKGSGLMMEKWIEFIPSTKNESAKAISLRVAISVTPPTPAPFSHLVRLAACLCAKACGACYTAGACATAGSCFTAGACATAGSCFTAGSCATAGSCGSCVTAGACATAGNCFTAGACATAGSCFTAGACATAGSCFTAGACATAESKAEAKVNGGACATAGSCFTAGACATAGSCFTAGACATAGSCFTAGACATAGSCFTAQSKDESKVKGAACATAGSCFTAGACATAGTCFTVGAFATDEGKEADAKVDAGTCFTAIGCAEGDNNLVSESSVSVACV